MQELLQMETFVEIPEDIFGIAQKVDIEEKYLTLDTEKEVQQILKYAITDFYSKDMLHNHF